ncbi:TPA: hypothetical protein NG550_003657 [Vibrio parahaemolyticus]|uniref:Uncharacterized protein n=1 Tax=Vibrio campbellii TaxID=680 RepID=A0ACC7R8A0_9VIBR|nr:hypothetical protein [Vibrio parahaemolyticus]
MTDFKLDQFNVYMLELSNVENRRVLELYQKADHLSTDFDMSSENPFTNGNVQSRYSELILEMKSFEASVCNVTLVSLIYPHMARAYLNSNNFELALAYAHSGYECSKLSTFLSRSTRKSAIESYRVLMDIAILIGAYESLLEMHNAFLEEFKYHQLDIAEIVLAQSNLNELSPQQLKLSEAEFKTKLQTSNRAPTFTHLYTTEAINIESAIRCLIKIDGCTREEAERAINCI